MRCPNLHSQFRIGVLNCLKPSYHKKQFPRNWKLLFSYFFSWNKHSLFISRNSPNSWNNAKFKKGCSKNKVLENRYLIGFSPMLKFLEHGTPWGDVVVPPMFSQTPCPNFFLNLALLKKGKPQNFFSRLRRGTRREPEAGL